MNCQKCGLRLWSVEKGKCPNCDKIAEEVKEEVKEEVTTLIQEVVAVNDAPERKIYVDIEADFLPLEQVLKNHTLKVLEHCNGNKTKACKILGVTVKTLYNKLYSWGLYDFKSDAKHHP